MKCCKTSGGGIALVDSPHKCGVRADSRSSLTKWRAGTLMGFPPLSTSFANYLPTGSCYPLTFSIASELEAGLPS